MCKRLFHPKYTADVRPLFQKGKRFSYQNPKALITDGATNFHETFVDEFYTNKLATRREHIRDIRMNGEVHNNKMERMNGKIRDGEREMRMLAADSPILEGYQIFRNYIRPHQALKGKTQEVADINVEGENKWLTIIQNASRKTGKS